LHRLLNEWQAMTLLPYTAGRYRFEPAAKSEALPPELRDMPGLLPGRLIWRLEQILSSNTPFTDSFSWERPLDLSGGTVSEVPLPVLVNAIKGARASGLLVLAKGWKRLTLPFSGGFADCEPVQLAGALTMTSARYYFRARRTSRTTPPALTSTGTSDPVSQVNLVGRQVFELLFSEAGLQQAMLRRRKIYESSRELSPIKETTTLRAWIEVRLEEFWEAMRPALAWFLPILLPVAGGFVFAAYKTARLEHRVVDVAPPFRSTYAVANEVLRRLQNRELLPAAGEVARFDEEGVSVSLLFEKRAASAAAAARYELRCVSPGEREMRVDIVDLNHEEQVGDFLIRRFELP
jgi:hypothetical protein